MKLAVNYSPQAAQLVERGEIEVDLFKCPDMPDLMPEMKSHGPCYVHFPFRAGRRRMGGVDWALVQDLVAGTDTPHVNVHLSPYLSDFPGMALETDDAADRARLIDAMERDVAEAVERLGRERVVLENVMWDPIEPWMTPRPALEPEVIRQVVTDTGCGFLLDLSHGVIAARYFGVDEKEYISSLPTDRTREMHVSGIRMDARGLWQDHNPMTDRDWPVIEWAMGRVRSGDWPRPLIVTFEYGGIGKGYEIPGCGPFLAEQVPRLCSCVRDSI